MYLLCSCPETLHKAVSRLPCVLGMGAGSAAVAALHACVLLNLQKKQRSEPAVHRMEVCVDAVTFKLQ
jgi:hypothetical protein